MTDPTPEELKALTWMRAHEPWAKRLRRRVIGPNGFDVLEVSQAVPVPAAPSQEPPDVTIARLHEQLTAMRHALRQVEQEADLEVRVLQTAAAFWKQRRDELQAALDDVRRLVTNHVKEVNDSSTTAEN